MLNLGHYATYPSCRQPPIGVRDTRGLVRYWTRIMAQRDWSAIGRRLGAAVLILAASGETASLFRLAEAVAAHESATMVRRVVSVGVALFVIGVFGWWAREGHPQGRNYALAALGPFLLLGNVTRPVGLVLLLLNLATAAAARKGMVPPSAGDARA